MMEGAQSSCPPPPLTPIGCYGGTPISICFADLISSVFYFLPWSSNSTINFRILFKKDGKPNVVNFCTFLRLSFSSVFWCSSSWRSLSFSISSRCHKNRNACWSDMKKHDLTHKIWVVEGYQNAHDDNSNISKFMAIFIKSWLVG